VLEGDVVQIPGLEAYTVNCSRRGEIYLVDHRGRCVLHLYGSDVLTVA